MKSNRNELYVYHQKDIQMISEFLEGLTVHGVGAARQVSSIATILESGKPLADYEKKEGEDDGTVRKELHADNMER